MCFAPTSNERAAYASTNQRLHPPRRRRRPQRHHLHSALAPRRAVHLAASPVHSRRRPLTKGGELKWPEEIETSTMVRESPSRAKVRKRSSKRATALDPTD